MLKDSAFGIVYEVNSVNRKLLVAMGAVIALVSLFAGEIDTFFQYAAAYRLLEGKVMYRDFAQQQLPLLPYIYAAFFWVTGVSLAAGRLIGTAFWVLTIWLSYRTIAVLNRQAGEAGRASSLESLLWVHLTILGPACQLLSYDTKCFLVSFLMIALVYFSLAEDKPTTSVAAGLTAAVLGLIKSTYAPIGGLYLLSRLILRRTSLAQAALFTLCYAAPIAGMIGYFQHAAPDQFKFITTTALVISKQVGKDTSQWLFGYLDTKTCLYWMFAFATGYLGIPFLVLLTRWDRVRWKTSAPGSWRALWLFAFFALGGWMFLASTVIPGTGSSLYFAPYMPVLMLLLAIVLDRSGLLSELKVEAFWKRVAIVALVVVLHLAILDVVPEQSSLPRPSGFFRMISQNRVAALLRERTAPRAVGLGYPCFPQPILQAKRDFVEGNETTVHWLDAPIPLAMAERQHILTKERWRALLERRVPDFILVDDDRVDKMMGRLSYEGKTLADFGYERIYVDRFFGVYLRRDEKG